MIIDATNLILGRLSSYAAKQALRGNEVVIVNSEKAVISGAKLNIHARYHRKVITLGGNPFHGPFRSKREDLFIKRTIRGMLPYKNAKGRDAFNRIRCYLGVPIEYNDKKLDTIKEANIAKTQSIKYVTVQALCKSLGR